MELGAPLGGVSHQPQVVESSSAANPLCAKLDRTAQCTLNQSLTRVSISKNLEKKLLLIFSLARENQIFISLSILDFQDF